MSAFHVVTFLRGGVDIWALVLLVAAAGPVVVVAGALRRRASADPANLLAVHAIAYVVIAGSIAVHSAIAGWKGSQGGGLFWMVGLWGVGFIVHAAAVLAERSRSLAEGTVVS